MPPPLGSYLNKSSPRAKARMQKPQGGDKFLVEIPGGARREGGGGRMVMDEIDTCITPVSSFGGRFFTSIFFSLLNSLYTVFALVLIMTLFSNVQQQFSYFSGYCIVLLDRVLILLVLQSVQLFAAPMHLFQPSLYMVLFRR